MGSRAKAHTAVAPYRLAADGLLECLKQRRRDVEFRVNVAIFGLLGGLVERFKDNCTVNDKAAQSWRAFWQAEQRGAGASLFRAYQKARGRRFALLRR